MLHNGREHSSLYSTVLANFIECVDTRQKESSGLPKINTGCLDAINVGEYQATASVEP